MNIRGKARHHTSIVGAIALAAVLLTPSANAEDTPPQPSTLAMTQAGLTRAEVNSNNLELRADGHFYAPGDVDPTIDPIDEDQIAPSLFPSRETSHFAPPPPDLYTCLQRKDRLLPSCHDLKSLVLLCKRRNNIRLGYRLLE